MKKFYALLLCLALCITVLPPVTAVKAEYSDLADLASQYITVSVQGNETVYSDLQEFYSAARKELPHISDMQLAKYVLDYIGQPYDNLPDETILETLDFLEASAIDQVYRTLSDGSTEELSAQEIDALFNSPTSPLSDWISEDGYLRISTYAYKEDATKDGTPYVLSGHASWLKFPVCRFTDTFSIVYGGVFDDSYQVIATFIEEGSCTECGKKFKWDERERYAPVGSGLSTERSDLIELDYSQSHAVGAKYDLKLVSCIHHLPDGMAMESALTTRLYSSIRFRIIVTSLTEAQAAYVHTQLGGSVSISGEVNGTSVSPKLDGHLNIIKKRYYSIPVTLRCN